MIRLVLLGVLVGALVEVVTVAIGVEVGRLSFWLERRRWVRDARKRHAAILARIDANIRRGAA